jgi:hypothetical protein
VTPTLAPAHQLYNSMTEARQSAQVRTAYVVRVVAPVLRTAAVCVFGAWSIKEAVKMPDDRRALTCFSFREAGATVRAPHERIFEAHSRSLPGNRRPGEEILVHLLFLREVRLGGASRRSC